MISADFDKIASRELYDCPINFKFSVILFHTEINKLCKFEVPGYPGTPSKNSLYFWVEKVKFLIISSKMTNFHNFCN